MEAQAPAEGGMAHPSKHRLLATDADPSHLVKAIHAIRSGYADQSRIKAARLTTRQREVLTLAAAGGQSNAEIAGRLHIAPGTVKRHLNDIFWELDARSRLDAVNRARSIGLL